MPEPTLHLLPPTPEGVAPPALLARAEAALGPVEQALLKRYTFPKRRRDWLLGRLAAKEAIRLAAGADWALSDIAVTPLPDGRPVFTTPEPALPGWGLSISHGHGRAAALVAPGPVGLDLEAMRPVPPGGWRFFLNPEEREWLGTEPLGPVGEIVVWALKEAGYKALEGAIANVLQLKMGPCGEGEARLEHPQGVLSARYVRLPEACLAIAAPPDAAWLAHIGWPEA